LYNYEEEDSNQAIYLLNKAAVNGYEIAQYNLGRCYQYEIGVEKDEIKALNGIKNQPSRDIWMHNSNLDIAMELKQKLMNQKHLNYIK